MMDYSAYLTVQHGIFGVCPKCMDFFRLSDCKVFSKKKPVSDWMDAIEKESERLAEFEQKISEMEDELREKAREKGRKQALDVVKKIDPIFVPRKLNPDDAKVIFHPIDYVVFNGMKTASIQNIILLDRQTNDKSHKKTQKSIEKAIDKENYCWQTIRVCDDGKICVE
jgi:predicted Holliday junction resolvase-like endonuclease